MPKTRFISSTSNAAIRRTQELKKRRVRDSEGLFRIEGHREIQRALEGLVDFVSVFHCPHVSRYSIAQDLLAEIKAKTQAEIYETSRGVFDRLSQWQNPDGLLVVARKPATSLESLSPDPSSVHLVVNAVEKPGNLGAMFRSADAAGCSGILLADPIVDPFNPNVVRGSLGTLFSVPFCISSTQIAVSWLRQHGKQIIGTSPTASLSYESVPLTNNCAIVIGSEKQGLSTEWLDACDVLVSLPTEGRADSINAAMSATVMLFESHRQRKGNSVKGG